MYEVGYAGITFPIDQRLLEGFNISDDNPCKVRGPRPLDLDLQSLRTPEFHVRAPIETEATETLRQILAHESRL